MERDCNPSLPLFDWKAPTKVIVFPLTARVGKIRRAAEVLESKRGPDADGYWKAQTRKMSDGLAKCGVASSEIDKHVRAFWLAVDAEMLKRSYERPHGNNDLPGGAS
ncbi:DUF6074 family protein [Neorhizobium sp. IRAMC:178]|uniref:DUF6074 family protein n=1 Tax=Neorhizobium tunisiense TaxID=3144793 RepID=UPI0031F6DA94